MTIIALPPDVTPTIVCPDWCTIPAEEHLADLRGWEGSVIHHSATVKAAASTSPARAWRTPTAHSSPTRTVRPTS
jgi:hypothetical protein